MIALDPTPSLLVVALGISMFFSTFSLPLAPGALQEIMPNAMRGQATAVYVGLTNLVGGGLAATAVAVLTDFIFQDKAKLHVSFGLVGGIAGLLAALILTATLRAFRTTVREHQAIEHPSEASPEYG
jgi:MFS family permease